MKRRTITILATTILASLIMGAIAVTILGGAPPTSKLKVRWRPRTILSDQTPPTFWYANISFVPPRPVEEVNVTTILLENEHTNASAMSIIARGNTDRLLIPFDGTDVMGELMEKLTGHLTPGLTYHVDLLITGKFNDDTSFSGTGRINIEYALPPPP